MEEWLVYLENVDGDVLDITSVDALDQHEAKTLGDEIFKESEYSDGYPEGYEVVVYKEKENIK
ncbi:hypothetical protein BSK59_13220 [Paenibacillus odorifer]|uniref:hypothetical protein n=1 Tax=Paenibacillus odorifer TaxID=189426 RepID=UPI00096F4D44|nr:hypothetical protein [Paenibacillus odorifer]OME55433.1 hypothetical protein BSK59_13220 [Paenibacillus odorifer]